MTAEPEVSVIVPVLNGASTITGLLDALEHQRDVPGFEVVIVDNGSSDDTPAIVQRHPLGARLVQESRRGSYAARNRGLEEAHGIIVAFTDADCVPESRWLAEGVAGFAPGVDLVAGEIAPIVAAEPSPWERYDRAVYLDQRSLVEQGFGATANLFVRRAVFDAVGMFDATLVSSGDLEFGLRSSAAGFGIAYAPGARVQHHPRRTLSETWKLHRRLGAGWARLARRGDREGLLRDPALRLRARWVASESRRRGVPMRVREVLPVHLVAMAARWWGRLTRRP